MYNLPIVAPADMGQVCSRSHYWSMIRLQRIYNFDCSMLLYYLFWMFNGFIMHFYIIFGTNLLTEGPVQIVVFAYFSVLQKRNIKQSPNGTKPSGELFLEQTQSRRLGVDVKK